MPTITLCTDAFESLGKMEGQSLRMPKLPIVVIHHPLGGLKPEEVIDKARLTFKEILKYVERR